MPNPSTLLDHGDTGEADRSVPPAGPPTTRRLGRPSVQALVDLVPALVLLVGGWRHRWMDEDAFINLRIVDQIVAGHGPVFNAGERIEAFTSPLWLLILVVVRATLGQVMAIEWAVVVVSLAMATGAFWLAARTTRRLHSRAILVVPVGLLAIAAVPVVWDFATSGLEMALVWLWLAGCWALLVDAAERDQPPRRWARTGALAVLGLGPLVRPDLALMSVILVVAWIWMVRRARFASVVDLIVAFAPAVAYQVFRMGYYAAVVPSTALAKDAGGLYLTQGWNYALDLSRPYHLWIPLVVVPALIGVAAVQGPRDIRIAIGAMVAAGLAHAAYLVAIGGDYMHGRLLLPALFAVTVPAAAGFPGWSTRRSSRRGTRVATAASVGAVVIVALWAIPCALRFRYENAKTLGLAPITSWREISPRPLVQPDEAREEFWNGSQVAAAYRRGERGTITLLGHDVTHNGDPHKLVIPYGSIGITGYHAGTEVTIIDIGGLAEPLAARTDAIPGRPAGHRKQVDGEWYTARYGVAALVPKGIDGAGGPLHTTDNPKVRAARRALRCPPLSDLLDAVERPLTPDRFLSNVVHSVSYTRLHIPADPRIAERQFCGN
ncbi:MAG: hypothetical protein ACR2MB_09550 [Acidimicrobiales bacterium]